MSKKKAVLLALATAMSACSQTEDAKQVQSRTASQSTEVAGMTIESKGDASTVVTSNENEIVITGNKSVQNRACTGQDVQIQGDDNKANLTGTCKEVYIIGNGNEMNLENVAAIQVTGDGNTVRWRGAEPEVTNIGKGNTVAKAE